MKLFHFYKTFSRVCFKEHDWWLCVNIGTRYDHNLTHKRRQLFIKLRMSVFTDCITVSTGYNISQNIIVWQKMQRMNSNRFNNPPSKLNAPLCEPNEKIGWSAIWVYSLSYCLVTVKVTLDSWPTGHRGNSGLMPPYLPVPNQIYPNTLVAWNLNEMPDIFSYVLKHSS